MVKFWNWSREHLGQLGWNALSLAQVFPFKLPIVYRNDHGITCDLSIPPGLYPGIFLTLYYEDILGTDQVYVNIKIISFYKPGYKPEELERQQVIPQTLHLKFRNLSREHLRQLGAKHLRQLGVRGAKHLRQLGGNFLKTVFVAPQVFFQKLPHFFSLAATSLAQVFPLKLPIVYRNDYGITCDLAIPPGLYPGIFLTLY